MASNYLTGTMSVPTSAYGAMDQAHGHASSGSMSYGASPSPGSSFMDHFLNFQQVLNNSIEAGYKQPPGSSAKSSLSGSSAKSSVRSSSSSSYSEPEVFDYLDAPWASAYQMSKETAYNEAMTNTEYRRAVKDMQAAGLNPAVIFGAGNGFTSGVPGFISSSGGGGGGGGRSYGRGSGSNKGDFLFSSSAYSLISALGGIVGAAATKSAGGYWIGTSLAQGAMHAASSISKLYR